MVLCLSSCILSSLSELSGNPPRLTKGTSSTALLPVIFLGGGGFWEVSRSDLHTLPWPALKNFMSPWQRWVWGRGAPTFEKAGCCCLPTAARAPASPHNLRSDSYQPRDFHLFLYVHSRANKPFLFSCRGKGKGGWMLREQEKARAGGSLMYNLSVLVGGRRTWGVIWVRGGKVGGQNGEVRDVGGGWGGGTQALTRFPCYPSLCQVL